MGKHLRSCWRSVDAAWGSCFQLPLLCNLYSYILKALLFDAWLLEAALEIQDRPAWVKAGLSVGKGSCKAGFLRHTMHNNTLYQEFIWTLSSLSLIASLGKRGDDLAILQQ